MRVPCIFLCHKVKSDQMIRVFPVEIQRVLHRRVDHIRFCDSDCVCDSLVTYELRVLLHVLLKKSQSDVYFQSSAVVFKKALAVGVIVLITLFHDIQVLWFLKVLPGFNILGILVQTGIVQCLQIIALEFNRVVYWIVSLNLMIFDLRKNTTFIYVVKKYTVFVILKEKGNF